MIKKYFNLLFLLLLINIPNSVFAISVEDFYGTYGDGNSNAYSNNVKESYSNHIVHIEDLYFYDYFMNISGYAFIPYQDNYGGVGGNIKTYVVAFDGFSSLNEWSGKYISVDDVNGTISCINDNNCYLKEVTVKERDFWGSRCTGVGCANQSVITNYRLDERNGFNNTMTCSTEKVLVNGALYDSECLYHNVGFSVSLNLNSVLDPLVGDSLYVGNEQSTSIGFMIVTINTDVLVNKKPGVGIAYSQMYVPNKNCRYENTNGSTIPCSNDNDIITDNFSFGYQSNLKQISLNARFVTPLIQNGDGDFEVNGVGDDYYFYNVAFESYFNKYNIINEKSFAHLFRGYVYDTTNYYSKMVEAIRTVDGVSGPPFMDKLYELATYNKNTCNDNENRLGEEGLFGIDHSCAAPNYKNGNNYTHENQVYWAYSSWIKAQGTFVITGVKKNAVKVTCDVLGFEDGVQYIRNNVNGESNNVNCNDDLMNDITIRQCSDFGDNGYEVSGEIYIDSSQVSSSTCGLNTMYDNGTKALIEITTKVLLNQTGYFRFNKISDSSFRAGKGFEIISKPNIEFIENSKNTLNYNALLEWSYFMWTKNNGIMKPHYSVSANYYDSNCSKFDAYELLNNANNFYYKNVSGVYVKSSLDDAIFNAIDLSVQSTYYDVATVNNISNNIDKNIEKFNENVKVVSYDSNSNKNVYNDVGGKWNLGKVSAGLRYLLFDGSNVSFNQTNVSNSILSGRGSFYSYYYSLPNAYISLVDNDNYNYSDVLYTDGEIDESKKKDFYYVGNKYFVPLKFSGSFPFNLAANVNPSLINVMEWELNGTCSVEVENGLFDNSGKPLYKYRSISLKKPFPKGNPTSKNWGGWYKRVDNVNRLKNTFAYGDEPNYSFTLIKKFGANGIELAEINSCSSLNRCSKSYGTFDGLDADGISDFVEYYDQWANNQNSYCGLGFFSSRCDAFPDGTILDIEGGIENENGGLNEGVDTPIIIKPINPGIENEIK